MPRTSLTTLRQSEQKSLKSDELLRQNGVMQFCVNPIVSPMHHMPAALSTNNTTTVTGRRKRSLTAMGIPLDCFGGCMYTGEFCGLMLGFIGVTGVFPLPQVLHITLFSSYCVPHFIQNIIIYPFIWVTTVPK
jgi:hypothetical protein